MTEVAAWGGREGAESRAPGNLGDVGTIQHVGASLASQSLRVQVIPLFDVLLVRGCGAIVFYYYFYPRAKTRCLCGPALTMTTLSPSRSSGLRR